MRPWLLLVAVLTAPLAAAEFSTRGDAPCTRLADAPRCGVNLDVVDELRCVEDACVVHESMRVSFDAPVPYDLHVAWRTYWPHGSGYVIVEESSRIFHAMLSHEEMAEAPVWTAEPCFSRELFVSAAPSAPAEIRGPAVELSRFYQVCGSPPALAPWGGP